ncbi:uncharacterized protein LOC112559070 isoform X3 [Pomacea canaliculata]|uniref:uncharacterized protein LOC112559070 isoform X3 n=1 Tax=Pomacea canaliculata TaxID=400727 RepID=UPI000D7258ED|nr:uncharacterized protein LOC112559070 isoform X3 [Pomacea canaliculata]
MMATRVRLIDALVLAATVHAGVMSADDSTDNCRGDCGNDGVCEGDHYCSLIRGEPFCRPCSDIRVHYCHNLTYIKDKIPQCLYYCRSENKIKVLEQQLEARKTAQTDVWANPSFQTVFTVLLVALGVVAVLLFLYYREHRRKTASTEKESQPLMQPNSDTSEKVVVDTEMLFSSPVSRPPTQSDVVYETTSSNTSLKSTSTDNGSHALAVQHRTSEEDLNLNPHSSDHAGCKQETGREDILCDVTTCPSARRVVQSGVVTVVNNPTSEDCKCNRNVVTNVSRHNGDDV